MELKLCILSIRNMTNVKLIVKLGFTVITSRIYVNLVN